MFRKRISVIFSTTAVLIAFAGPVFADEVIIKTGVCRFEYTGSGEAAVASGISSRFYEAISNVDEHEVTPEELQIILSQEITKSINSEIVSLEKLYAERDGLIFSEDNENLAAALKAKDILISEKKDDISGLEQEKNQVLKRDAEDSVRTAVVSLEKPDDGIIFEKIPGAIGETADKYDLDLVVYGFIETIDQYKYVEVRLWNNIVEQDKYIWRTAVSPENINDMLEPGLNGIKTAVYGRSWAELSVKGPDNCMIYLNGSFKGIGSLNSISVTPGTVDIELRKSGSISRKERVEVTAETLTELEYDMQEIEKGAVIVQTWPAGADVYLDSIWIGKSPVKIELKNRTSAIRITKEGYEERNFFFEKESEKLLNINLKPVVAERDEWIPASRKRFYTSMGSFMLSIPLTSLFSSMLDQSRDAYYREMDILNPDSNGDPTLFFNRNDETDRLFSLNRAEYALYIASLGLNVFLFLDTIIQAVEYVGSVDYFSE